MPALTHPASGLVLLIDECDLHLARSWSVRRSPRTCYALVYRNGRNVGLHQLIMPARSGFEVDHINGDGLDNRRCNLRYATKAQNQWNGRPRVNGVGGFKGVTRSNGRFRARIRIGCERINLGGFATAEEAARAYDAAALRHFGPFARLNFASHGGALAEGVVPHLMPTTVTHAAAAVLGNRYPWKDTLG